MKLSVRKKVLPALLTVSVFLLIALSVWGMMYLHRSTVDSEMCNDEFCRVMDLGTDNDAAMTALYNDAESDTPAGMYLFTLSLSDWDSFERGVGSVPDTAPMILVLSDTGEKAKQTVDLLAEIISDAGQEDGVCIMPADEETARYLDMNYGEDSDICLTRGACPEEARELPGLARRNVYGFEPAYRFVLLNMSGLEETGGVNTANSQLVNYAAAADVSVVYRGAESAGDLAYLYGIGARGAVTENIAAFNAVIAEAE